MDLLANSVTYLWPFFGLSRTLFLVFFKNDLEQHVYASENCNIKALPAANLACVKSSAKADTFYSALHRLQIEPYCELLNCDKDLL